MEEKKNNVGEWLEKLQQESWNLELLVSGFSIFLLVQAYDLFIEGFRYVELNISLSGNINGMPQNFLGIGVLVTTVLIINLIVHVFIRGFWIGAVGLRSVQNNLDIDKLGYSDFFTERLKEKVPSLDNMLEKLDTLASVIFSFTFLIVFMFISLFLYLSSVSLFAYFVNLILDSDFKETLLVTIVELIAVVILLTYLIIGIIYAIDTLSLGFFKRYKRISKIYFPIYKLMGIVTMSGIYRSIYYTLISRFSKNKIRLALCVYMLLFFFIPFMKFDQYIFYPDNGTDFKISSNEYDDLRYKDDYIYKASIPSQIVKENFLPLFIRYRVEDNDILKEHCDIFEPKKKDGLNSGISINSNGIQMSSAYIDEDNPEDALECLSTFYTVTIDSVAIQSEFYFYIHPNQDERGVFTMLEIDSLSKGNHDLIIKNKILNRENELIENDFAKIVFWKE